jgi:hypothetical protein
MKRSPLVRIAYEALQNPNRKEVEKLLAIVNLSLREKEVIIRNEIDKIDLETICNSFESWNRKSICNYSYIAHIKSSGMKKIGKFLLNQNNI